MEIICNGKKRVTKPGTSIADFIREHGLDPQNLAVECDGIIISTERFEDVILEDGTVLELIRFVGGGASC